PAPTAGRRTFGGAGLGQRRGGHASRAGRVRAGRSRCRGDPRRTAGVVGRPGGVPPRRAGRRPDCTPTGPRVAPYPTPHTLSTALDERLDLRTGEGGGPARRAVIRWAWRLFRREWR